MKMPDRGDVITSGLTGLIVGVLVTALINDNVYQYVSTTAEIFPQENGPQLMRICHADELDNIGVQDPENPNRYRSLGDHLDTYKSRASRDAERARIYGAVNWYGDEPKDNN
jgi:hypothetical protein